MDLSKETRSSTAWPSATRCCSSAARPDRVRDLPHPGVSEAPTGALYIKFLAIDPPHRKVENLEQFIAAIEGLGLELGCSA